MRDADCGWRSSLTRVAWKAAAAGSQGNERALLTFATQRQTQNYLAPGCVTLIVSTTSPATLSRFDRLAVGCVTLTSATSGLLFAVEFGHVSDANPMTFALATFPGFGAGWVVASAAGRTSGALVCSVLNGAAYGSVLYAWFRFMNYLARVMPKVGRRLGTSLRTALGKG